MTVSTTSAPYETRQLTVDMFRWPRALAVRSDAVHIVGVMASAVLVKCVSIEPLEEFIHDLWLTALPFVLYRLEASCRTPPICYSGSSPAD